MTYESAYNELQEIISDIESGEIAKTVASRPVSGLQSAADNSSDS